MTIEHREFYPVPYRLKFAPDVARMLSELLHLPDADRSIGNALAHLKMTPQPFPPRMAYPSGDVDEFGCVWVTDRYGGPYVAAHPLEEGDVNSFPFPDPFWPGRFEAMAGQAEAEKDRFVLFSLEWSYFERAHFLCGLEKFLADMLLEPAQVHGLLDRILDFNLAVIEQACQLPIDGVILGDDYGTQNGLIMNPRHWRRFFKPGLQQQFELIRRHGKVVCLHSCGDISTILPDLIDIGLEVLNPLQPEALDLPWLKQEYGRELCFYGGISTQVTLPFGSARDVRAEVRNLIEVVGDGGGYIIAPGIIVLADTPQENVLALLDAVQNQDRL
jgi:uroporphyrinogen decarboxylase